MLIRMHQAHLVEPDKKGLPSSDLPFSYAGWLSMIDAARVVGSREATSLAIIMAAFAVWQTKADRLAAIVNEDGRT